MKKLSKDFDGVCALAQLQKGVYFRILNKNGVMSKETYYIDYYDRSAKKYQCTKFSDAGGNGRLLNGTTIVTTDFIF